MLKIYNSLLTVLAVGLISGVNAQVSFGDSTANLVNSSLTSGVAIGIADMNGDGLDDLVRLDNADDLEIEYQGATGIWTRTDFSVGGAPQSEWAICVADVDSNGYNDILMGGAYNDLKLRMANGTGTAYTLTDLTGPSIFVQATNFADIDNNGTTDIFSCHDDGISSAYNNNGTGIFTYDLGLINAVSTVPSDNSGNYGTCWTDYDNDGDLDMYLSKCRLGVTNPMDGRRMNMLFQNDGLGNYTDVAGAAGLLPLGQSWSADFADIDNDGWLDVFIVHHDIPSEIYINNGDGTFTDITSTTGIGPGIAAIGLGIQSKFEDFDNDGFVDLFVTGRSGAHRIFWNNGNSTFTDSDPFPTGGLTIQSGAIGDLNNDGFVDVLAGFATGWNSPSNNPDAIFINDGNANNFFNILIDGVTGNRNGIGARIEIYGAWGKQIREIRAGESYGVFNTFTMHFGLGTATTIDSAIVRWQSGTVDFICGPSINQVYLLTEGTMPYVPAVAGYSNVPTFLSVAFTNTSTGGTTYLWDFGDGNTSTSSDPTYVYATAGTYTVCLTVTGPCVSDVICTSVTVTCAAPSAAYSEVSTGLGVDFTDLSTGSASGWSWDFGDGNTSTLQNPSHTYATPGTYTVCLIATSGCGNDTTCTSVTVSCAAPVTAFSESSTDFTASFTDLTTGGPATWLWDFGDGNTSTSQNPVYSYASAGTYTVCLTTTSICGTNSSCSSVTIVCVPPSSAFSSASVNYDINFTDLSTASPSITGWSWDFGDGNTSTLQNPSHTYAATGTYTVCLTTTSICGTDVVCVPIVITCPESVPAFTNTGTDLDYTFTDNSTLSGSITGWLWDFGDGNTSTLQNPTYTYAIAGTYLVCLTVTTDCNTDSTCETITVVCAVPTAGYTFITAVGDVNFTNTSVGGTTYLWDFGDGNTSTLSDPSHTYAVNGDYTVCLTITDACGTDSTCQVISITTLGIDTYGLENNIQIYPNPSDGIFTIEILGLSEDAAIEIVDSKGKIIESFTLTSLVNSKTVDLTESANGVYVISISTNNESYRKMFVKQ